MWGEWRGNYLLDPSHFLSPNGQVQGTDYWFPHSSARYLSATVLDVRNYTKCTNGRKPEIPCLQLHCGSKEWGNSTHRVCNQLTIDDGAKHLKGKQQLSKSKMTSELCVCKVNKPKKDYISDEQPWASPQKVYPCCAGKNFKKWELIKCPSP
jgi:hypothetical protein